MAEMPTVLKNVRQRRTSSKSNVNCCVDGCNSVNRKNCELNFHSFPAVDQKVNICDKSGVQKEVNRRTLWESTLRLGKPVSKYMRVCSKHFKDDDYLTPNVACFARRVLKKTAIPSERLPKYSLELSSNVPTKITALQMEKDMANYSQYKMGFSQRVIMQDGVLPSKFDCQNGHQKTINLELLRPYSTHKRVKPKTPNPFEIQFLPRFDPEAEGTTIVARIEHETKDYDPLSSVFFDQQSAIRDFKPEDSLSKPGSSFVDTEFSSSDVIIKNECDESEFDIEGRQYADDLRLLLPEQRNLVRQFVAKIMSRAKMNRLTLKCFEQL